MIQNKKILVDKRIIEAQREIFEVFRDKNLNIDEANAVLCGAAAAIIKTIVDQCPNVKVNVEKLADIYKSAILENYFLLYNVGYKSDAEA